MVHLHALVEKTINSSYASQAPGLKGHVNFFRLRWSTQGSINYTTHSARIEIYIGCNLRHGLREEHMVCSNTKAKQPSCTDSTRSSGRIVSIYFQRTLLITSLEGGWIHGRLELKRPSTRILFHILLEDGLIYLHSGPPSLIDSVESIQGQPFLHNSTFQWWDQDEYIFAACGVKPYTIWIDASSEVHELLSTMTMTMIFAIILK